MNTPPPTKASFACVAGTFVSTPIGLRLGGHAETSDDYTRRVVNPFIRYEYHQKIYMVDHRKFFSAVLNLPGDKRKSLLPAVSKILNEDGYIKLGTDYDTAVKTRVETNLYHPWCNILNYIKNRAHDVLKGDPLLVGAIETNDYAAYGSTNESIKGVKARRKPDIVFARRDVLLRKLKWPHVFAPGEVKKARRKLFPKKERRRVEPFETRASVRTQLLDTGANKVNPTSDLPPYLQLASYSVETMSTVGNRRFCLGWVVTECSVQLWYFDRAGGIGTQIDMIDDAPYFAMAAISLSLRDRKGFGFEPLFQMPPPYLRVLRLEEDAELQEVEGIVKVVHEVEDVVAVEGLKLAARPKSNRIKAASQEKDKNDDAEPPIRPEYETLLHFIVVVQGETVQITHVVYVQYGGVGRGTIVCVVEIITGPRKGTTAILKVCWQGVGRIPEQEILMKARELSDCVPEVYLSQDFEKLSDTVRGLLLEAGVGVGKYEDRVLRVIVMGPECAPLYQAPNLQTFMLAFIDIVKCHRRLYMEGDILHRDISVGNLMFLSQSANHRAKGMLIDFDLAVICPKETPRETTSAHRTGATPFLAIDLLKAPDGSIPHRYRHDLESFYYVLIWVAVRFNGAELDKESLALDEWHTGSSRDIASHKSDFLTNSPILALPIHKFFLSLRQVWFIPLHFLFRSGYNVKGANNVVDFSVLDVDLNTGPLKVDVTPYEDETMNGHVTYEEFLRILEYGYQTLFPEDRSCDGDVVL